MNKKIIYLLVFLLVVIINVFIVNKNREYFTNPNDDYNIINENLTLRLKF